MDDLFTYGQRPMPAPKPADEELWSIKIVRIKTGLSRASVCKYMELGLFPRQRHLGPAPSPAWPSWLRRIRGRVSDSTGWRGRSSACIEAAWRARYIRSAGPLLLRERRFQAAGTVDAEDLPIRHRAVDPGGERIGRRRVAEMRRERVRKVIARRASTPGAANGVLQKNKVLIHFTKDFGRRIDVVQHAK